MPTGSLTSPPSFGWEAWYAAAGGRSIAIEEVGTYLKKIFDDQYPLFEGPVASERRDFASPEAAAEHLKEKAQEFGADIVGICEIEPTDVYRDRTVPETYAIAVGQRMRWREFQVVPLMPASRGSATRAVLAASTVRRMRFPITAARRPARIISVTTATSSTRAGAFRTSPRTRTVRFVCLSACTTTKSGHGISRVSTQSYSLVS